MSGSLPPLDEAPLPHDVPRPVRQRVPSEGDDGVTISLQGVHILTRFHLPAGRVWRAGVPLRFARPLHEQFPENWCAQDRIRRTGVEEQITAGALPSHDAYLRGLGGRRRPWQVVCPRYGGLIARGFPSISTDPEWIHTSG